MITRLPASTISLVVANGFDGMAPIERHRAVHHAIDAELQTGEVHSMQMRCWTVAQWQRKGEPAAFSALPHTPSASPLLTLTANPPPQLTSNELLPCLPSSMGHTPMATSRATTPENKSHKRPAPDTASCQGDCDGSCFRPGGLLF